MTALFETHAQEMNNQMILKDHNMELLATSNQRGTGTERVIDK